MRKCKLTVGLILILAGLSGCQVVSGLGRDITAMSDGVAKAASERSGR